MGVTVVSLSSSWIVLLIPYRHPKKRAKRSPPAGRRILVEIKLAKLKGLFPKRNVLFFKSPSESALGTPRRKIIPAKRMVAFFLLHFFSSIKYVTMTSSIEIPEVSAAMGTLDEDEDFDEEDEEYEDDEDFDEEDEEVEDEEEDGEF